jgi:predicted nucleic acid-binding protein
VKLAADANVILAALAHLPSTVVEPDDYERKREEAFRRIADGDPDDVDLLALALARGLPVWSNDNDFEDAGIAPGIQSELFHSVNNVPDFRASPTPPASPP